MHQQKIFVAVGGLIVLVSALLFLCGTSHLAPLNGTAPIAVQTASVVPFTPLVQSTQSEIQSRANYLITSQDELNQLWKTIGAEGAAPTVDFSTHQILAVFAGSATTSAIRVAKIEDTTTRDVLITIVEPDASCAPSNAKVIPYELVAVSTTSLPLTHEDAMITIPCPN